MSREIKSVKREIIMVKWIKKSGWSARGPISKYLLGVHLVAIERWRKMKKEGGIFWKFDTQHKKGLGDSTKPIWKLGQNIQFRIAFLIEARGLHAAFRG